MSHYVCDAFTPIITYLLSTLFIGEAQEVHSANPWVTYGDPLHKLREFGASLKEMDLLDESSLSSEQMRVLCSVL